jgi:RNA recognition motif-containing protein
MEEVQAAFSEYGEVKDVFMPSDYDGNPRGFAFVQMEEENALKAIEGLNGVELGGRTLNVKKSLPKGTKAEPTGKCEVLRGLSFGVSLHYFINLTTRLSFTP